MKEVPKTSFWWIKWFWSHESVFWRMKIILISFLFSTRGLLLAWFLLVRVMIFWVADRLSRESLGRIVWCLELVWFCNEVWLRFSILGFSFIIWGSIGIILAILFVVRNFFLKVVFEGIFLGGKRVHRDSMIHFYVLI